MQQFVNPKIGISKVTLTHKGIETWCSIFVVPGISPALLGMPDGDRLQLQSVNWDTIEGDQNRGQVKEWSNKVSLKQTEI